MGEEDPFFNDYALERRAGTGASGSVSYAVKKACGGSVAAKFIDPFHQRFGSETQGNVYYPTTIALKQKAAKKKEKADLEQAGKTKEEIKQTFKKKRQEQDAHYDDCGSDFEPIVLATELTLLALPGASQESTVEHAYFDEEEI